MTHIAQPVISAQALGSIAVKATERATLNATEASEISASEALGGIIATNAILSQATAYVKNSALNATTDTPSANNEITIEALNLIVANADVSMTIESDATTVGLIFAFNTVGYKSTNVFFQAAEALLGADYLTPLLTNRLGQAAIVIAVISELIGMMLIRKLCS